MSQKIILALAGILFLLSGIFGTLLPARAQTATGNLTGTISQVSQTQLTLQSSGHAIVLQITSATIIHVGDKSVGPGELKIGMSALVITADEKTASEIRASVPHTTTTTTAPPQTTGQTGIILTVGEGRLTLQAGEHTITYTLTTATVTKLDGKIVGAGDLKPGMNAVVFATDGKVATEIRATRTTTTATKPTTTPPNGQTGTITQLRGDGISIQSGDHAYSYGVPATATITLDGKSAALADLKTGMYAVVFATEGKTTEIRAYTHTTTQPTTKPTTEPTTKPTTEPTTHPATSQSGTITALRGDGISIKSGDHTFSFGIPNSTPVKLDGNPAKLSNLKLGMEALIFSADGKTATEVRAYTPHATTVPATSPTTPPAPNQTGTITQVEGLHLTLQAGDHTYNYTLTTATVIKLDGKVVGPGDLKSGLMAVVFSTDGKVATEVRAYTPPAK